MTLQGTNLYLVGKGASRILVDAGQDGFPEAISSLTELLKQLQTSIGSIVITHWHQDHIGGLGDLAPVFKKSKSAFPEVYKFPRTDIPEEPSLPDGYTLKTLTDNHVLETDGASLKVLFTPGHTTDHAALLLVEEQAVFSGDCILGEGTSVFEDLKEYMTSLQRILDTKPKLIYPGHGPVVDDPQVKIQYYLNHRLEREKQILEVIASSGKAITPEEIVKIAYKETPENLHKAAEYNVRHHLDKLLKEKRVLQRGDTFAIRQDGTSSTGKL